MPIVVSSSEDLEVGDRIHDVPKVGVDGNFLTEVKPKPPMSILLFGI